MSHIWLHKQPLSLWLISVSLKMFGINEFAVRIPSIILSTIGIKLVFDLAKVLYDTRVALLSAFLFSINGLIVESASVEARHEYQFNTLHFFEAVEEHKGGFFYHFDNLRIIYGEAIYLPIIWFLYRAIKRKRIEDIIVLTWFLVPFLFFSFSATKMPAYTVITSPAIFIVTALAFYSFWEFAMNHRRYKAILALVALSFIVLPVRYAVERIKPFANNKEHSVMSQNAKALRTTMQPTNRTVIFNCPYNIEAMFYTDATAYEFIPEDSTISRLEREQYEVIILK